jgi:hypothetical protein
MRFDPVSGKLTGKISKSQEETNSPVGKGCRKKRTTAAVRQWEYITSRIGPSRGGNTQPERVLNSEAGGTQIEVVKLVR